jgi:RNA polymerase sigma-70 factor (ECF subfamily)
VTDKNRRFETEVLPHLDAAYNLARWLLRDEHAAEDVVQDAYIRAFQYFDSFRGGDARPWLLGIVRNACYTRFQQKTRTPQTANLDDDPEMYVPMVDARGQVQTPETMLDQKQLGAQISAAIAGLPMAFREVLILREIEEMSYDDIASIMQIPTGTVMSRLSRARAMLKEQLGDCR